MGAIEQPLPASQSVLALANDGFILLWRPCRRICVHRQVMGKLATVTIAAPTVVSEEMAYLPGAIVAVPVIIVMATIGLSRPKERISKSLRAARMKTNLALPFGAPARSIFAGTRSNVG